ncbi:MAG: glycosyltransferase family 2 protein [Patescibacteria group bacterium]
MRLLEKSEYMKIGYAKDVQGRNWRIVYKMLEILPAFLAWGTLILLVALSFILPYFVAIFIIIFDIYWLAKTIYLSLHLRSTYKKIKENTKINWLEKIKEIPRASYTLSVSSWENIYHLVILPMYNESLEIVDATLQSVQKNNYPKDKMLVVLAVEEAGGDSAKAVAEKVREKYQNDFFKFLVVYHPKGIEGEIPGKGSNAAYAGRVSKKLCDDLNLNYKNVIVSALDVDTVLPEMFFARLAFLYLTSKNPERTSFQPVPFFLNNIWEAPSVARVVAFSSTFWHMIQQERPERQTTFSSHSMSMQTLVDVDFWQVNMVSEDSRIFWQCFLRYDGDYKIQPMFFPVYMDANVAKTFWRTMKNVYKQQRRWGFGVENVPYFLFGFIQNKKIPFKKKIHYSFVIMEGFHSWATNALIIFLFGWLPVLVGGASFDVSVLSYNLPRITRDIMNLTMLGIVTSAILSIRFLPPRPPQYGKYKFLLMFLQWILIPITLIFFGAIPGLEAQTRLAIGKYLGFWPTEKHRKNFSK